MSTANATPEQRYAALVESLIDTPGVTHAPEDGGARGRFGSSALKVDGRIFAMLTRGRLVVKLSRRGVDALVASGDGQRFDPGHGRLMREWLSLEPASALDWLALAREAMQFVASGR